MEVAPAVTTSVTALAVLAFGLKRLYGIDLDFKTHRERRRQAFIEAKRLAEAAERRKAAEWDYVLEAAITDKGHPRARWRGVALGFEVIRETQRRNAVPEEEATAEAVRAVHEARGAAE